jgi:hypothetical protein
MVLSLVLSVEGNAPLVTMQPLHDQKKLIRKHNQSPFVTSACTHCGYIESCARTPENLRPDA